MGELDWKYVMVHMPTDKPFLVAEHQDGRWKYAMAWWDAGTTQYVSGVIGGAWEPLAPWWFAWAAIPEPDPTNLNPSQSAD